MVIKQFIIQILRGGLHETRFVNTSSLFGAECIAKAIYGEDNVLSVQEV